jgi:quinol monooxygenase YgiN
MIHGEGSSATMLARVTTLQMQPGKLAEADRIMHQDIVPALKLEPGNLGVISLINRETGQSLVISFWESRESLDANEARGFWQSSVAQTIFLIATVPSRDIYELSVGEFPS